MNSSTSKGSIITKITQQKKDLERFNVFLNNKYAFSVHESVLVKFELRKDMVLEDWSLGEMLYEEEVSKAFNRALHYLGFRMRSEYEVKEKLLELEYGESVILEAIAKLKRLGFLDDEKFSEALLETRKNTSKKGPRAIQQELQKKGISKEMQANVMESFTEEDQLKVAIEIVQKEARKNRVLSPRQNEQRIQNSLLRKGYSFAIIKEALQSIDLGIDEDEWEDVIQSVGGKAWRRYSSKYSGYDRSRRVKQAMYQKGIPLDRIDQFIEMKEQEDE